MLALYVSTQRQTTDPLLTLIRLNRESQKCFRAAGDGTDDPQLTALFYQLARERGAFVEQLSEHVADDAREAVRAASPPAARPAVQRWWQAVRQRLAADEVAFVLRLAERAEEEMQAVYDALLHSEPAREVAEMLAHQREAVAEAVQRIRTLQSGQPLHGKD